MLLSIDKSKIDKMLAETPKHYVVTSSHMDAPQIAMAEASSACVYGTISNPTPITEKARQRLLTLRQKIVESGTALLGTEALEREVDDIRGRSNR
jgi:hypothetical protein